MTASDRLSFQDGRPIAVGVEDVATYRWENHDGESMTLRVVEAEDQYTNDPIAYGKLDGPPCSSNVRDAANVVAHQVPQATSLVLLVTELDAQSPAEVVSHYYVLSTDPSPLPRTDLEIAPAVSQDEVDFVEHLLAKGLIGGAIARDQRLPADEAQRLASIVLHEGDGSGPASAFVARLDGRLIGHVTAYFGWSDTFFKCPATRIVDVFVLERHRGKHVTQVLVEYVKAEARARGYEMLLADVLVDVGGNWRNLDSTLRSAGWTYDHSLLEIPLGHDPPL